MFRIACYAPVVTRIMAGMLQGGDYHSVLFVWKLKLREDLPQLQKVRKDTASTK